MNENRTWQVTLPALPANREPTTIEIRYGSETQTLDNVLVGDVWIIAGQSNMQHPLANVEGGALEMASSHFPELRLLTVPPMIDGNPKANFPRREKDSQPDGDWDVCSPTTVREFSAIGYIFGRRLHMASQIPIGLIDVSRWGTTVESWTPEPALRSMENPVVQHQLADWDAKAATFDPEKDLQARIANYRRHNPDGSNRPPRWTPARRPTKTTPATAMTRSSPRFPTPR